MMSVRRAKRAGLFALGFCALGVHDAAAQKTVGDKAAAEALFDHGRELLSQGRFADACAKFAESQRLDAGVGTLLYLADCYEKIGQTASAWAGFREAAAAAHAAGQLDREKIARERSAALEKGLSKLTIMVEPANVVSGVEVRRNGVAIGSALWGTPIPVDPGVHTITASAAGKKTWSTRVRVPTSGASVSVNVPPLEQAPIVRSGPARVPHDREGTENHTQRNAGIVLGAFGLVGLGVGAAFGLAAVSKDSDADAHCRTDDPGRCDEQGVRLSEDAHTAAAASTIAFGIGTAALALGIMLVAMAPSGTTEVAPPRAARALRLSPTHGGGFVSIGGAF
jgi:serine/threonine-protein kinase